ncbi:MAG: hypothetical protein IJX88_00240 [Clostridia bacterium]|nr:hypothetical protein [Clostridia bacterium]
MKGLKKLCVLLLAVMTVLFAVVGCNAPNDLEAGKQHLEENAYKVTESKLEISQMHCTATVLTGIMTDRYERDRVISKIVAVHFDAYSDATEFYKEYAEDYKSELFSDYLRWDVEIKKKDNWVVYGKDYTVDNFFALDVDCTGCLGCL